MEERKSIKVSTIEQNNVEVDFRGNGEVQLLVTNVSTKEVHSIRFNVEDVLCYVDTNCGGSFEWENESVKISLPSDELVWLYVVGIHNDFEVGEFVSENLSEIKRVCRLETLWENTRHSLEVVGDNYEGGEEEVWGEFEEVNKLCDRLEYYLNLTDEDDGGVNYRYYRKVYKEEKKRSIEVHFSKIG